MLIKGYEFYEDAQDLHSPRFSYAGDASRVTRYLQFRPPGGSGGADDVQGAACALLGYSVVVGGNVVRYLPHAYPAPTSVTGATPVESQYAVSIPNVEPRGVCTGQDAQGRPTYGEWVFTVQYSTLPYIVHGADGVFTDEGKALADGWASNSRFVAKFARPACQMVTMRQGLPRFVGEGGKDPEPLREGFGFPRFRSEIRYLWMGVPAEAVPFTKIKEASGGAVNNDLFDSCAAGTLLLTSVELQPAVGSIGNRLFNVGYSCVYMPNWDQVSSQPRGWNSLMRAVDGAMRFWRISTNGEAPTTNENRVFPYVNFKDLFRAGT